METVSSLLVGGGIILRRNHVIPHLKKSHTVLKHDRISSSVAASGLSSLRSASTSLVQNFSVTGTPHSPVPTEGTGSTCIWEALEEEPMVGNPLFLSHKYN